MADRVERLTNLLALLLETSRPLSLVEIAGELEAQYPDDQTARRGSFERDKAALRDIGVPIETEIVTGGEYAGQTRYRIDRATYELDELDLTGEEMRALQVAVAAVRTDTTSGVDAIWKLGGAVGDEHPAVSAVVPDRPELPALRAAVSSRSAIEFEYRGERRRLDPWGVLLRGGFWYVIGHDHDRGEQRTFRIDRVDGAIETLEGVHFERPPSFDPRDAFPADPKRIGHGPDDGREARVLIDAVRAAAVERELGADRVVARRPNGDIEVEVPASNDDAFRSWVLGLLDHAVVLGPDDVRNDVVAWLTDVASGAA